MLLRSPKMEKRGVCDVGESQNARTKGVVVMGSPSWKCEGVVALGNPKWKRRKGLLCWEIQNRRATGLFCWEVLHGRAGEGCGSPKQPDGTHPPTQKSHSHTPPPTTNRNPHGPPPFSHMFPISLTRAFRHQPPKPRLQWTATY